MIKTIHYSRVERVDYKFTESEIKQALMVTNKIEYDPFKNKIELEICEDSDGKSYALLSVIETRRCQKRTNKTGGSQVIK